MTNEEFEKRKQFILEQQAQFAVGMQRLREAQAHTARVVTQAEEIVARCEREMLKGSKEWKAKVDALSKSQMETKKALNRLRATLDGLRRRRDRN